MDILLVASVAVVAADPPRSRKLFMDALGLPLEGEGYYGHGSHAPAQFSLSHRESRAMDCSGLST